MQGILITITGFTIFFTLAGALTAFGIEPEPAREQTAAAGVAADAAGFNRRTVPARVWAREDTDQGAKDGDAVGTQVKDALSQQKQRDRATVKPPVTLPEQLLIPSIGLVAPVRNPASSRIAVLEQALLSGVVRYPNSARMGEGGTMILFGHSSNRPVVLNPNFKIFNRIHTLVPGDEVRIRGGGWEEVYRVRRVRLALVDGTRIALQPGGKRLVLITCNTLGAKEERYIVEAAFVGRFAVHSLPQGAAVEHTS